MIRCRLLLFTCWFELLGVQGAHFGAFHQGEETRDSPLFTCLQQWGLQKIPLSQKLQLKSQELQGMSVSLSTRPAGGIGTGALGSVRWCTEVRAVACDGCWVRASDWPALACPIVLTFEGVCLRVRVSSRASSVSFDRGRTFEPERVLARSSFLCVSMGPCGCVCWSVSMRVGARGSVVCRLLGAEQGRCVCFHGSVLQGACQLEPCSTAQRWL